MADLTSNTEIIASRERRANIRAMRTVSSWLRAMVMVCALLCASCLTMTLPKSARVEPNTPESRSETTNPAAGRLMGAWELMYQMNDKNEEKPPRPGTRTLIEFKDQGRIVWSRAEQKENESDSVNRREGNFSVQRNEIHITDDAGNSDQWPYQIAGETLITEIPREKLKFYWKRTKP